MGVNSRGAEHIRGFLHDPRTEIRAIVDPDEEVGQKRVTEIADKQGVRPEFFKDIRDALEMKGIDIVSSATPNHWHALMGIWAMQAGKDVYIEKPICHNIHEGQALVATAAKYGRQCQTEADGMLSREYRKGFEVPAANKVSFDLLHVNVTLWERNRDACRSELVKNHIVDFMGDHHATIQVC
ncbi:Glycosyl hydrolase [Novipirellula aureliae]|uniref:Glycosyl hydrolase n=1 Tax=Novipirellula aureliae TaxID=2527966 RepID=A0A5C6DF31_9BACT|nr:Gfo/Idh/MocA family oxidoreductase [Novipirellula aureliae]TWU35292.1 Glycosyl hydrolase [Novipirellula aureliae]